jgi:hypothetical protein
MSPLKLITEAEPVEFLIVRKMIPKRLLARLERTHSDTANTPIRPVPDGGGERRFLGWNARIFGFQRSAGGDVDDDLISHNQQPGRRHQAMIAARDKCGLAAQNGASHAERDGLRYSQEHTEGRIVMED